MSNIVEIKDQICDVCHKMWQLGWVAANDGNVTAMLDDGTLRFLMSWSLSATALSIFFLS